MRAIAAMVGAWLVLVGCGGNSPPGGTGGGAGTATGTGGSGATAGASGAGGRGGNTGSLPACAITTRPNDPTAGDAGGASSLSGTCNTIVVTPDGVTAEMVAGTDGGIVLDGGAIETPAGGTIQNGDYDLIRWQNIGGQGLTYRTLRVFGGGTYIEWDIHQLDPDYDGGFLNVKWNTTATLTGTTMTLAFPCGGDIGIDGFDYTAAGNDLLLFDLRGAGGSVDSVDTYRRTCAR